MTERYELDMFGRRNGVTQIILLSGASDNSPSGNTISNKNYPTAVGYSIGGGQGDGTVYLLDGGANNDFFTNVNLPVPFPDALQEFSVLTNALPAQYGLHAGGVVNMVTKAGTNQFHGDVFEYLRNGYFDARNYFAPKPDTLKRNQFGGVVGGPVFKNKLLFRERSLGFLLGLPNQFRQGNTQLDYNYSNYFALYAQDAWRLSPRLTVNLGLRWEPYFPNQYPDREVLHFSMSDFLAGTKSKVFTNAPAGLTFPGDAGWSTGNAFESAQLNRWAPRVGIVWDPRGDGRQTVRASYGIRNYTMVPLNSSC